MTRTPTCDWEHALRDAAARGITRAQLAAELGVSLSTISRVIGVYHIELPRQRRTPPACSPALAERDQQIESYYREGKTLDQIGASFGITRERVRQILMRAGVERRASSDASYWTEGRRVQAAHSIRNNCRLQTNPSLPMAIDLVREGYSFSEAAAAIGGGLTRNAVAGACHRAGVKAEMTEEKRARTFRGRPKRLALER